MDMGGRPLLLCDVTQSYSDTGGGIGTYIRQKRAHIAHATQHRHLLIIPGEHDEIVEEGALITARVASPPVPGSPNYRLLLRNRAVVRVLERFEPDVIECLDAYNLPWAALAYRGKRPEVALVAGYRTDFPTVYVQRVGTQWFGRTIADALQRLCYRYCGAVYGRFDAIYALSESGGAEKLRGVGVRNVDILPLGVDLARFNPSRRDAGLRARLGVAPGEPLLVYAGRIDNEKRCGTVFEAFRKLDPRLGATLLMLGEGKLRQPLMDAAEGLRVHMPGFEPDRGRLATALASADIYVSGMADETFGISIIEAQAAGLPIVGVAAGAMIDRVPPELGRLGPVDDSKAMAANIEAVWASGAAAMGAANRAHVAERFSWTRTFGKLLDDIYPRALARRASALRGAGRSVGGRASAAAGQR